MSAEMEAPRTDVAVDNDSIREECEELIACENAHPVSETGYLSTKTRSVGEWLASRPWGQMVFKSVDRVLWCVERTMLWQNPSPDPLAPMVRPVNALVAYPLAAFLWILQHLIFVTGEMSSAKELTKWVQTRRRRLRAVRFLGIRNMRSTNVLSRPESSSAFTQVLWFLGMLPAGQMASEKVETNKDEQNGIATEQTEPNKKRSYSAVSETADEGATLLDDDDYNSESDSDYVPEFSHSSESSDSDSSSDDEETEEETETKLDESVREAAPEKEKIDNGKSKDKN